MAKSNDDLANALAALAAGEVKDDPMGSGTEHAAQQPPPAKAPAKPTAVQKAAAPAPRPPAAPAKPVAQDAPRPPAPPTRAPAPMARPTTPAASVARPASPGPARPAATPQPAEPQAAAPPPPPRVRPAAPTRAAAPIAPNLTPPPPAAPVVEESIHEPAAEQEVEAAPQEPVDPNAIYDDGDDVIMPAPSADVFKAKAKPKPGDKKPSYTQTLAFKQTVIPVMLTLGVILLVSAGMPYIVPTNSGLAGMKDQIVFLGVLAGVGLTFLAFAGLNMMQVKSALAAQKRR